ncbi:MAG: hypothetical protein IJJ71_11970 [Treponema sp.]|uniref:hypothetical protein n=1 Tax=Treponema sp. TaxID=166 RepID=UPI0025FA888A|nr:hypothetical protein [Treponema sp.]MBR0098100.1 hypothetical protein [Treponema sp.]MBR0496879.1 hypothetical protein [Treponema sp.]
MKKLFAIFIATLIGFCAFAQETLVLEKSYIQNQEGLYWEFTVPPYSQYIKVDCSTSAEFSWKMSFAVVPSKEDVIKFCANRQFSYVAGSYKKKGQDYSVILKDLTPGETYYFCAFNGTMGFTAAKQYTIVPTVTAY